MERSLRELQHNTTQPSRGTLREHAHLLCVWARRGRRVHTPWAGSLLTHAPPEDLQLASYSLRHHN